MKKLLHLKHWQLFLLMTGVPVITFLGSSIFLYSGFLGWVVLLLFPLGMIFTMLIMFSWLYTIGVNIYDRLPSRPPSKLNKFKASIIIPFTYLIIEMVLLFSGIITTYDDEAYGVIDILMLLMHIFSMLCIFYAYYFIAKTLKSVELQREASSGDYIGDFFALWFFFFGIWLLQPRINRLFRSEYSVNEY